MYQMGRDILILLTLVGMFTSALQLKSSLTTSVCPLRAALSNAVSPSFPLALISKLRTWDRTWPSLPSLAAV